MKELVCTTPGVFEYQETEKPILTQGHSILEIKKVGVCGTDLHAFSGNQPFFTYPRRLGHEIAAKITSTNNPEFKEGEAVTILPYFYCGKCIACRNGKENCCTSINVCGVHIDGAMAEYITVPDYSLVHGEGLSYEELALVEPLAIGAHGVRRADVRTGEFVLVLGAGPIGLGIMELARIAGAKVIALDINEKRLQFCQEKLGVEYVINSLQENVIERLQKITQSDMPTVIIDATGNQKAINGAFQYLAHGGRYVLVGLQKGEISFIHPEFHKRESTLMSSRNANRIDFEHVIDCMKKGLIKPTTYITHTATFEEVKANFENWLNPENGVIKAMISF
ncbi:zinc-binding alcohol dehydrogenase family protein [Pseudopedobacter beijingensis]|uniref:Zinc-binding alcohol dehydrogenase family protein n=1 Tax=Pseudopedobacter beijingensis TaxID=1207056 RepID=A0ABW4I8S8_9SPHI